MLRDGSNRPPDPPLQPLSWLEQLRGAPASLLLTLANIAVFALAEHTGSTKTTAVLMQFGATSRQAVWHGEWWRLVTSMFLHIGIVHLVWNTWFGIRMNAALERRIGSATFLILYVASGVVGSAMSVIGHDVVSAGASGALFGVIGYSLIAVAVERGSIHALVDDPALKSQVLMILIWFGIGLFSGFDNYAHFGGLLMGALFAWCMPMGSPVSGRALAVPLVAVAFVFAARGPLPFIHADELKLRALEAKVAAHDVDGVLRDSELLMKTDLRDRVIWSRLWALKVKHRFEDAKPLAEEAVSKSPDFAGSYSERASISQVMGDNESAVRDASKSISMRPAHGETWATRAKAQANLGHLDEALSDAEHAVTLERTPFTLDTLRTVTVLAGHHQRALELFDEALKEDPKDVDVRATRAKELMALRRYDEARDDLRQLLVENPDSVTPWAVACDVFRRTADEAETLRACERAHLIQPARDDVLAIAGWAHLARGENELAATSFREAIKRRESSYAYAGASMAASHAGALHDAEVFADGALALDPNELHARLAKAEVLLAKGDRAGAKSWLLKTGSDEGGDWWGHRYASPALLKLADEN